MLNAAIVGLGRWGRRLVDSVQQDGNPKGELIRFKRAVVRTAGNASDYAAQQGLTLSTDLHDALSGNDIDAVVLATPHDQHAAQILAVSRAGKHVFVEKPLALTLAEAEPAAASVRDRKQVLALGHNRRFLPAARKMKTMLADQACGIVLHIEGNFSNASGLLYHEGMWRAAERGAKSAMTAMGIHMLDFFISLCGPIHSVRTTSRRRAMAVDVADNVQVEIVFRSGATGTLGTMLSTPRHWRVQLFGTKAWMHMRGEHILDICAQDDIIETLTFDDVDSVRLELEAFARAARGGEAYAVTIAEALHATSAFESILKSADEGGSTVIVPPSAIDDLV
jgi:predicted dehydrogenase